jgi:hypothetical protein
MLIRLGYDIQFHVTWGTPFVALLSVHPSREQDLLQPDELRIEPEIPITYYLDSFGNRCARFTAPPGTVTLRNDTLIEDAGKLDAENPNAREVPVQDLPDDVLQFLLASRYCEVDALSSVATELFGSEPPGWGRVQAISTWVNQKVRFGYGLTSTPNATASVATSSTSLLPFVGLSTFPRVTPPVTWATSGCRSHPLRWISAPGSRSIWKAVGGPATPATMHAVSAGC